MTKHETSFWLDAKHLLIAGGLAGAVLGTLILGAVLRVEPNDSGLTVIERVDSAAVDPTVESPPPAADVQTPAAPRPSAGDRPAARAIKDAGRLSRAADRWTLQFMVTCTPQTAADVLERLAADSEMYMLPLMLNDQPCLRICWGNFASRDRAVAANGIPPALTALNADPIPRPIVGLLP